MTITVQMRTEVSQLYVALFGRAPDGEGLGFWVGLRDQGQSLAQIANTMYATSPARAIYPSFLTNQEIISSFYQNVLGRTADADGLAFWTAKLGTAGATPGSVISDMINTVANYTGTDAAGKASAALFNNRVTVAQYYGEKNGNVAGATTVLQSVTSDTATVTTAKASVDGTIATGSTFTLTTGVDSITGTANNDVINATASGALSVLDSIDGGAGTDTLNVTDTAALTIPTSATVKNVEIANITTAGALNGNVSGWTGLNTLTATATGNAVVQALTAGATNVTFSNSVNGTGATIGGTINVTGGKAVTITNTLTQATAGTATTGGAITVTGTADTTAVTVNQTAAVSSTANVTETATVTWQAMTGNGTQSIGGMTITNATAGAVTAAQVATVAGGGVVAGLTITTAPTLWTVAAAVGSTNVFTSVTANSNVADITGAANTMGTVPTAVTVQGSAAGGLGIVDGGVTINDANAGSATKAATISSATLSNYGNSTISSNALANLSLSGTGGTVGITSGLTTETVKTLNLTVNNLSGANTITDSSNHFTTINITGTGKASTIANIVDTAATALNVAGDQVVTLTSAAGLSALKTVGITGSGGLTADVSGLGTVTSVDASASSGANTITIDATKATYAGGSGVDTVTIAAAPTKSIDGGAGSADVLVLNVAAATFSNPSGNTNIKGFEILGLGAAATGAYDATGFTGLTEGAVTAAVTYNNVAAGAGLTITAAPGFGTTYNLKDSSGTADSFALTIKAAGGIAANTVTAAGIESVSITATDTTANVTAGTNTDTLTLAATAAKTITITGNANLNLTNTGNTAVTSIDASAMTGGLTVTTAGTVAETVKGGAAANFLTAGAGTTADVLIGGAVVDTFVNNAGLDVFTGGGGNDIFKIDTVGANVNTYTTITDTTKGDVLWLKDLGTETLNGGSLTAAKVTLASTAVFQDYANAVVNAGGNAATNGAIGWFQFNGDTYVVESLHNATTTANFTNGTDLVVKLTGLIDLTKATFAAVGAGDSTITFG